MSFNCTSRAVANSFEYLPIFFSLLACSAIQNPRLAGIVGIVYNVGRVIYFKGYSKAASKRTTGFAISVLSIFTLLGLTIKTGVALALQ